MPANNVDLTALLPVLASAVKPFEMALRPAGQLSISPHTRVRAYVNLADMPISTVQTLVDAVNAVRRVAGEIK